MGHRIDFDTAQKLAASKADNKSIFAPQNKWGYTISINNPKILPLYEMYKRKNKIIIMSDKERFDFERLIYKLIEQGKISEER